MGTILYKNTLKSFLLKTELAYFLVIRYSLAVIRNHLTLEDLTTLRVRGELDLIRNHYVNKIK